KDVKRIVACTAARVAAALILVELFRSIMLMFAFFASVRPKVYTRCSPLVLCAMVGLLTPSVGMAQLPKAGFSYPTAVFAKANHVHDTTKRFSRAKENQRQQIR